MSAIIVNIVEGLPQHSLELLGIDVGKNAYIEYIKYIGIVCLEANKRKRRNEHKW